MHVAISIWDQTFPGGNAGRYMHVGSPQNRAVPPGGGNFSDTSGGKSTAKIGPPPETVVLKKLFAGKRCSYLEVSKFIS